MRVIALSGKRESGKSTCADYLVRKYGAVKVSFATALREELIAFGYPRDLIYLKPTPPEIRALLIAHGNGRRFTDPSYWVKKLLDAITGLMITAHLVVIDDLRFWNEAEKLRTLKVDLVRVGRAWGQGRDFIKGVDDDPSETDLDEWNDWDRTIIASDGQVEYLQTAMDDIMIQREAEKCNS